MADPRLILGKIATVNGTTPGPSSGISYDIAVHDPEVSGVYMLSRQAPIRRWPDTIDIDATPANQIVIGVVASNRVQWHFVEYPAFADCSTTNASSLEQLSSLVSRLEQAPATNPPAQSAPVVSPD